MAKAKAKPKPKTAKAAPAGDDPQRAALLAAIIAHPDDKKPRLVYADHLQGFVNTLGSWIVASY